MNPQNLLVLRSRYLKKLSAGILVNCFLNLSEDCIRWEHVSVLVRAVDADKFRVDLALAAVDIPYSHLEPDVCLVNVLGAFEITSVSTATLTCQL